MRHKLIFGQSYSDLCKQCFDISKALKDNRKLIPTNGSPYMECLCRYLFTFILISTCLIKLSTQDLIGSSLLKKRETGSRIDKKIDNSNNDWVLSLAIDILAQTIEFYH